jgi:hypothetical protein
MEKGTGEVYAHLVCLLSLAALHVSCPPLYMALSTSMPEYNGVHPHAWNDANLASYIQDLAQATGFPQSVHSVNLHGLSPLNAGVAK